jgi:hypothetical protein
LEEREEEMRFTKGNKMAPGGPRPGSGGPTKAEMQLRRAEVIGLEKARATLEKELAGYAEQIAERYVTRALQEKADAVLMDAVRKIMPDSHQEVDVNHRHAVVIQMFDGNAERRKRIAKD